MGKIFGKYLIVFFRNFLLLLHKIYNMNTINIPNLSDIETTDFLEKFNANEAQDVLWLWLKSTVSENFYQLSQEDKSLILSFYEDLKILFKNYEQKSNMLN